MFVLVHEFEVSETIAIIESELPASDRVGGQVSVGRQIAVRRLEAVGDEKEVFRKGSRSVVILIGQPPFSGFFVERLREGNLGGYPFDGVGRVPAPAGVETRRGG